MRLRMGCQPPKPGHDRASFSVDSPAPSTFADNTELPAHRRSRRDNFSTPQRLNVFTQGDVGQGLPTGAFVGS